MADNYLSKINRVYIDTKTFKDDNDREVEYTRLCLKITINGAPKVLEFSAKTSKIDDVITFLELADEVDQGTILN